MSDLFLDEVIRPDPDQAPPRRADRRAGREDRQRKRRRRRRRSIVALLVSLALVGGGAYAAVTLVGPLFSGLDDGQPQTEDYPGPGTGSAQVVIPKGATGIQMATILHEADVVASERAFIRAYTANAQASTIQAGVYELAQKMTAAGAVEALLDPARRVETKVTIPEGHTVEQILEKLSSVTAVPVTELEAAMKDPDAVGLPAEAKGKYEGWLYPATYTFQPDAEPRDMIKQMITKMVQVLEKNGVAEGDRQEVLTKASLVERESPDAEASPKMARAIENRLERDMRLQIDASVAYGLKKSGTELTRADVSPTATENPYNTYAHNGLPPTPIASPGEASIQAVLDPEPGPWVFWVTVNLETGETKFSETYDQHQEYQAELDAWMAENG